MTHARHRIANIKAQHFRSGDDSEDISWHDAKSVFNSTVSSVSSAQTAKSKASSKVSRHSSILSLNAKQALHHHQTALSFGTTFSQP